MDNECLKYQALIRLAIDSGARAGELLGLEWKDINFDKKSININKTLILTSNGIEEKNKPKNNSSIRIIRITDDTVEILKAYKDEQELIITKLKSKWNGCKKVFTSNSGGYMYLTTPVKIIKSIAKKYNLPSDINFHSLRHTSASIQIALGIHTKVISKRLGHSSITITDNIYSHISSSLEDEVVNKMNSIFTKKNNQV